MVSRRVFRIEFGVLEDFYFPFGGSLDDHYKWVRLAAIEASMMVYFRKCSGAATLYNINELLIADAKRDTDDDDEPKKPTSACFRAAYIEIYQ
jgi:hypothetical protein